GTPYSMGNTPLTAEQSADAAAATETAMKDAGAAATALVWQQPDRWAEDPTDIPADALRAIAVTPERSLVDSEGGWGYGSQLGDPQNNLAVISADDLETVTGIRLGAAQRAAYRDGAALVTDEGLVTGGRVEVAAWTVRQLLEGRMPNNITAPPPGAPSPAEPQWSKSLDAFVVDAPHQSARVAIAPQTAAELGIDTVPAMVFGAFAEPPTTAQRDELMAAGDGIGDDYAASIWVEQGPPTEAAWLFPLLVAVSVLVLGTSAVALGLARFERRPDDATLSAVGGTAALRRRIGFWQGLVIAGFGTFAGAVAGILPPIGFWLQSQTAWNGPLELRDVPWLLLAALAVALPLGIAVVNWLVPPRRPDLTRRTAIA
ncbi:MAG: ABC transporter permease, partial [Microbacterium sp.]